MLKIILIILIFSISSLIGYQYGEKFRKRFCDLTEVYKNIILLQNEVVYNNTPLPEAFEKVGNKSKGPYRTIFNNVSNNLNNGNENNVFLAFKKFYDEEKDEFYLLKEDMVIIGDFLKSLGESGVYGQENIFKVTLENLKLNINESNELAKKNTKLYRYLGISFGGMIAIFLL